MCSLFIHYNIRTLLSSQVGLTAVPEVAMYKRDFILTADNLVSALEAARTFFCINSCCYQAVLLLTACSDSIENSGCVFVYYNRKFDVNARELSREMNNPFV